MSDFAQADIAGLRGVGNDTLASKSTSRKNNTELNMEDFLQLMIVQLTSQTIDDTMDTSEMMNQMVQMQMISAITNLTDASIMGYAASLVGQVVTVGIVQDNTLEEREILVTGTGTMNGQQVIFGSDGETYGLNQIMAVGRLPAVEKPDETEDPDEVGDKPVDGAEEGGETTEKPDETGETGGVTQPDESAGSGGSAESPDYNGEAGAPTD